MSSHIMETFLRQTMVTESYGALESSQMTEVTENIYNLFADPHFSLEDFYAREKEIFAAPNSH